MLRCSILAAGLALLSVAQAETVSLTSLDLSHLHYEGWQKPQVDKSINGKPLAIAG